MIYLQPEVRSGLGEDTFWTWFNREFESSFDLPPVLQDNDIVLQYSTLGPCKVEGGHKVALCWELYPHMAEVLNSNEWNGKIHTIMECAKASDYRVVPSILMSQDYAHCGDVRILPIGVDSDLFHPYPGYSITTLRKKYGLDPNQVVFLWAGTTHKMKGFQKLLEHPMRRNPEAQWILVWKSKEEADPQPWAKNFIQVPQITLNELFNCATYMVSTSLLLPFYMIEWEAMMSGLRIICNANKDFIPSNQPREQVMKLGWDRHTAKGLWQKFFDNILGK
jgi:glycosyltransferase involved in cell wall biosynthesis